MHLIEEVHIALIDLARMGHLPENEAKTAITQAISQMISDKLRLATKRHIIWLCDAIVVAGFSSTSDSMEPDGEGGLKWDPERSQIHCDCIFRLVEVMKGTKLRNEIYGKVMSLAIHLSTITAFCRHLKLTQPMPNLLIYEGRNEAAHILRPKMPELIKKIQNLLDQAKELEGLSQYKEAAASKKFATKLTVIYSKMEKIVLPGLEKQNPITLTTEKVLRIKLANKKT